MVFIGDSVFLIPLRSALGAGERRQRQRHEIDHREAVAVLMLDARHGPQRMTTIANICGSRIVSIPRAFRLHAIAQAPISSAQ